MADRLTPAQRSLNMSRIRGKDTKPELLVRRLLHGMGYRYRLHRNDLPGRPDIVLPKHRAVIFVHGCFWHGHDCHLFRWPATREEFWREKITRNVERDGEAINVLHATGWRTVVVWECCVKGKERLSSDELSGRLLQFLESDVSSLAISTHPTLGRDHSNESPAIAEVAAVSATPEDISF